MIIDAHEAHHRQRRAAKRRRRGASANGRGERAARASEEAGERRVTISRVPISPRRPEDQDQDQQQIGNDRRELRHRHLPEVAEERRREPDAEDAGERAVDGDGEGLDEADQQRGDEGAGQRAEAAHDDDDEQDRPEQRRHGRLGDERRAGDHAGEAARAPRRRRTRA